MNKDYKSAIVTGPTGEVGLALVDELLDNGYKVFAVVRPNSKRAARLPHNEKLVLIENELDRLTELPEKITTECDLFYHLAWDFSRDHDNVEKQYANIGYTLDAVKAACKLGCKVFIGAGSQAEYGVVDGSISPDTPTNPTIAYGMAKLCAGQLSRKLASQCGIKHIWPRIISIYGPGDAESTLIISAIRKLLAGEHISFTKGEQLWDFLYSKDCARAMRLIGEKGHDQEVYCIGSGEKRPLSEFIEIMRDQINKDASLGFGELPYRENQVMKLDIDISNLVEDTGFKPVYDFTTGIVETIEWCKNNEKIFKQEESR